MIRYFLFFPILAYLSYEDFREKKVHLYIILTGGGIGVLLRTILYIYSSGAERSYMLWETFLGIGFGLLIYLLSRLFRGRIGEGDAFVILLGGLFLGFWENMRMCLIAFYGIGIAALFLLLSRKKKRSDKIAFLPFLFAAFLVEWCIKGAGKI